MTLYLCNIIDWKDLLWQLLTFYCHKLANVHKISVCLHYECLLFQSNPPPPPTPSCRSRNWRKSCSIGEKTGVKRVIIYYQEKTYFGYKNRRWYWGPEVVSGDRYSIGGGGDSNSRLNGWERELPYHDT